MAQAVVKGWIGSEVTTSLSGDITGRKSNQNTIATVLEMLW